MPLRAVPKRLGGGPERRFAPKKCKCARAKQSCVPNDTASHCVAHFAGKCLARSALCPNDPALCRNVPATVRDEGGAVPAQARLVSCCARVPAERCLFHCFRCFLSLCLRLVLKKRRQSASQPDAAKPVSKLFIAFPAQRLLCLVADLVYRMMTMQKKDPEKIQGLLGYSFHQSGFNGCYRYFIASKYFPRMKMSLPWQLCSS